MEIKINLTSKEQKDLEGYCKLNNLKEEDIVKKSYLSGFRIEKYGLLSGGADVVEKEVIKEVPVEKIVEKEVIKEVIKEVPVEKIVEKEVIKEVPVEKIVEKEVIKEVVKEVPIDKIVIKEVIKEVPVEKIVYITDQQEMQEKIFQKDQEFESERKKFSTKMEEMESIFQKEKNDLTSKIEELTNKEPEIVEVVKEVVVEKQVASDLQPKLEALQNTVQKLKQDNIDKDNKIKEFEKKLSEIQNIQEEKRAVFLRNSNLNDTLYK